MVNGLKNFKKAQKEKENKNSVSVKKNKNNINFVLANFVVCKKCILQLFPCI